MVKKLNWTIIFPVLAWILFFVGNISSSVLLQIIASFLLIMSVLAAVHHSEVIAHKVGEPFGTIVLAVAITIIEVSIIISLMQAGGSNSSYLARDTVFAATMLILNGILGCCLMLGAAKHHEQFFSNHSTNTALISLVAIIVFTLILPNYTTSERGPVYSEPQLIFVSVACLVIYGGFLLTQTVRHRNYFVVDADQESHDEVVTNQAAIISLVFLLVCLGIVVLLAKKLSPTIEEVLVQANLPKTLVGVIIAFIVLLPESIAAIKAARNNHLQVSLNLALGSALASIGLTIPAVAVVCSIYDIDLALGIDTKSMVLLALSILIVMLSLSKGKTNMLYGLVLLMNLVAYIFTIIYP